MKNFIFGLLIGSTAVYLLLLDSKTPPSKTTITEIEEQRAPTFSKKIDSTNSKKPTLKSDCNNICETPSPKSIDSMCRKKIADMPSKQRIMWIKGIDPDNPPPGAIEEKPPGTLLADGSIPGEAEASVYIEKYETQLFEKLQEMDADELRDKYGEDLHWFQRVGNFRKSQKCSALQKMQRDFGLNPTSFKQCVSNIMEVDKDTWGDWKRKPNERSI